MKASDPAECFNATFSGVEHHEAELQVKLPSHQVGKLNMTRLLNGTALQDKRESWSFGLLRR